MSQPFVGQILAVGFNFAPQGWLLCNGQLLPIADNEVLFTLLGTTYGGDGQTTFGLPDLRGAGALAQGQGPSQPNYILGQTGGTASVTLNATENAAHAHPLMASATTGTTATPAATTALAANAQTLVNMYGPGPANATLAPASIGSTGGNQPHENRQPFLAVTYIIAQYGVFPSQS